MWWEIHIYQYGEFTEKDSDIDVIIREQPYQQIIQIRNPYRLRYRIDRILADLLGQSRTEIKRWFEEGKIVSLPDCKVNKACMQDNIKVHILKRL